MYLKGSARETLFVQESYKRGGAVEVSAGDEADTRTHPAGEDGDLSQGSRSKDDAARGGEFKTHTMLQRL
jgi:hypothetical protein